MHTARPTNTSMMSETTEQVNESSQNNLPTAKKASSTFSEKGDQLQNCDVIFFS